MEVGAFSYNQWCTKNEKVLVLIFLPHEALCDSDLLFFVFGETDGDILTSRASSQESLALKPSNVKMFSWFKIYWELRGQPNEIN